MERDVGARRSSSGTGEGMSPEPMQGAVAAPAKMRKKPSDRKEAEDHRSDNAFLAAIVRSSEDAIIGMDLDGNIQSWNLGSERIFGYSSDEVMGKSVLIIYPPEHEEELSFIVAKMRKGESINHYETHRRKRDGTVIDVSLCFSPIRDDNGEIIGMAKIVRDFTGQRTASQYARSLIEASLDPFVTISPEGKIMDVNHATELMTGVSREWLIGTDFSNYFTEPRKARQGYRQAFKEGSVRDYPLAMRHSSGNVAEVLYNATVYRDAQGKVRGVFAAARDVTETKKASQYARSLIEASLDPLVTISLEGKITDVNEATISVTGVSREQLIGTDFSNYFTEPEKARAGYEQVFQQGFVTDYALTIRHASGKTTDVLYNASVYKDDKGNVLGVFAAARDYSRVKQTTQQLEASNRELEAFSYSVSHDLRAPLRSIDGFSQALLEDYADKLDELGKRYLHSLRKSSQEMAELIDDMLQLSQLSRGKLTIKDNVDLSEIAHQIAQELAEGAPERKKVEFIIENGLMVKGDARLLRAALQNLLGNAWKFTSKHPTARIEFGASMRDGKRIFFVKDNGAGFDMAFAGKLFGVFQRLHGKEEFPGTGIGLATAQRIINRHGGKIWAEGEPDKGATFYFTLD